MIFRRSMMKWFFRFWPCIRNTGARVTYVSPDFHEIRVELPLNWRTRNYVGTIFGGSLYAAADPFYMIMLMEILGRDYVVWDKAASIRFKRPGRSTLHYHFKLTPELIREVKEKVAGAGEMSFDLGVNAVDASGVSHAEVTKTLYVATQEHYREKMKNRTR